MFSNILYDFSELLDKKSFIEQLVVYKIFPCTMKFDEPLPQSLRFAQKLICALRRSALIQNL